jgi:hypothetical protein
VRDAAVRAVDARHVGFVDVDFRVSALEREP